MSRVQDGASSAGAGRHERSGGPFLTLKHRLAGPLVGSAIGENARPMVFISGIVAVALIGLVDAVTPPDVSLAAFYLLPTVAITILVSDGAGVFIAIESCIAWILADLVLPNRPPVPVSVGNGVMRLFVLLLVLLLLSALRDALAEARASDRRSREFLGFAAHQLRTPVSGLRSSAEALLMSGMPENHERLLTNVAAESARVGRLVSSLLRMARLDQGVVMAARPTDLLTLCCGEVDRARDMSPGMEIGFDASRAPAAPVLIDSDAVREALANLLDNAGRHATSRVNVIVAATTSTAEIAVADDGPGLPPGAEHKAFERFASLDGHGGAGLGLPIARSLVEAQGGKLTYERGRFVMSLPLSATR